MLCLTRRELETGPEMATAPALDPTDERRLETKPRRGVRHRNRRKPPATATPFAYRHRASRRLYTNVGATLLARIMQEP